MSQKGKKWYSYPSSTKAFIIFSLLHTHFALILSVHFSQALSFQFFEGEYNQFFCSSREPEDSQRPEGCWLFKRKERNHDAAVFTLRRMADVPHNLFFFFHWDVLCAAVVSRDFGCGEQLIGTWRTQTHGLSATTHGRTKPSRSQTRMNPSLSDLLEWSCRLLMTAHAFRSK